MSERKVSKGPDREFPNIPPHGGLPFQGRENLKTTQGETESINAAPPRPARPAETLGTSDIDPEGA